MGYEIDINRAGSARMRQELGLATSARAQGREGASPHYRYFELEPALVIEVDITNDDATKIGWAKVRPLYSYPTVPEAQLPIAVPLDSNIKSYPLKNEVVIVVEYNGRLYYTQRLNFFNLTNQNITKDQFKRNSQDEQNKKDYAQTSAGNPNQSGEDTTKSEPVYFITDTKVQSLLPLEGDIIYEGRFGNSIRFGGSIGDGTPDVSKFKGTWAQSDKVGSPIIILRNGQKSGGDQKIPYIEDINKDPSSVYITNGHIIPLKVANTNQKSWAGAAPSVYDGNQVVIASDRIIFNARKGEIMMFATAPIGFSTAKSFFVDAGIGTVINSPKIYLGLNAKEPVLLGNKTKAWEESLIDQLTALIDAINSIVVLTGTGPSNTVQSSPGSHVSQLAQVKTQLNSLKGKLPTLLSKQNFSL